MSHMNIVKFHVNPDYIDNFLDAFKNATLNQGQISGKLVQIAENKFCSIGLWESQIAMDEAMDDMISFLDKFIDIIYNKYIFYCKLEIKL